MENINYYGFDDKKDVANQFQISLDDDIHILFAEYNNEDYSGNATVIFEQKGKLYEVHGSHCSCYGLEGQWDPEQSTYEDIIARAKNGNFSYVNCSLIEEIVEKWKISYNLRLDFDFDNLPNSNEIIEKFNIQKLIEY